MAFNVCAISDAMFEDALFGHVRGAFTGAVSDSPGLLRKADQGTAFFDEISVLAAGMQVKLLRAIETGAFRAVGGCRDARSDFRVVATNEPLDALVATGRFRAELAHRIGGIVIHLPSLAERAEDVPVLVRHFLRTGNGVGVHDSALRLLEEHPWPGNVRELRQVVE